jgi:hypothetical protein
MTNTALPPLPKFYTMDSPWKEFREWSELPMGHPDAGRLADAVDAALGRVMQAYAQEAVRAALANQPGKPDDERDAKRYRWLRRHRFFRVPEHANVYGFYSSPALRGGTIDEAIDASMAKDTTT